MRISSRIAAGAAAAIVLLIGGLPATAAAATQKGSLQVWPTDRSDRVSPYLTSSAPCPTTTGTVYVLITGGDAGARFPSDGQLMMEPAGRIAFSTEKPFTLQTTEAFRDVASDAGIRQLKGRYRLTLICQSELSERLAEFVSPAVTFGSPTRFSVAGRPATRPAVADPSSPLYGQPPAGAPMTGEPGAGPQGNRFAPTTPADSSPGGTASSAASGGGTRSLLPWARVVAVLALLGTIVELVRRRWVART